MTRASDVCLWISDWLRWFGQVFNLNPPPLRRVQRTDAENLAADWQMVGDDIRGALERAQRERLPP